MVEWLKPVVLQSLEVIDRSVKITIDKGILVENIDMTTDWPKIVEVSHF